MLIEWKCQHQPLWGCNQWLASLQITIRMPFVFSFTLTGLGWSIKSSNEYRHQGNSTVSQIFLFTCPLNLWQVHPAESHISSFILDLQKDCCLVISFLEIQFFLPFEHLEFWSHYNHSDDKAAHNYEVEGIGCMVFKTNLLMKNLDCLVCIFIQISLYWCL